VAGGPARFYAGHPVSTADGWRIGSLCLIDDRPRTFTEDDERDLQRLAAQVRSKSGSPPGAKTQTREARRRVPAAQPSGVEVITPGQVTRPGRRLTLSRLFI
jgi:hypothetical protein